MKSPSEKKLCMRRVQEKDPAKWTWQNYSQEWCMMIETAFELDQPIATLGDYEIDFKKRLQINRKDRSRIRRVRRQSKESRFMIEIPEPMIVEADEKTMNQAFGTVQHFLEYIMKRTPEAFQLYQRLKGLSLDTKEDEFKEIVKEVISCIRKAAGEREKVIKERYASAKKTHIEKAEELVEEIIHGSKSLRDFLRTILKIYTTESFVCYWLNELLRKDNWTEITPCGQNISILISPKLHFFWLYVRRKIRDPLLSLKISSEKRALQKPFFEQVDDTLGIKINEIKNTEENEFRNLFCRSRG